ncbi:MarR family transcriptional regulator [Agromyces bracchium]|uniref:HTH marR-type domain-containing protein n=1 Tax=Agromyces bracchium TaxID=88376 RepID=A0A6I3MBF2_9MICO|nr:helix-turn-helix domain-containing protein [Agromyces bracchium]MTH69462.1 hypothetical protein [Agromyces bracchium]
MPARVDLVDLPPRAAAARDAVAGHARVAVLRFLLDHPDSTRPAIVAGTGISSGGVRSALAELEQLGFVDADAAQPRRGQRVRYAANRRVLTDDLTAFVAWMLH